MTPPAIAHQKVLAVDVGGSNVKLLASGENRPLTTYDLANGGVALTDEWSRIATLPVDTDEFYQEADRLIRTGEIEACPDGCGGSLQVTDTTGPDA